MKGGARKGAGRKPTGSTLKIAAFKIERSTIELLNERVRKGKRAPFVDQAILRALDHLSATEFRSRA